MGTRRHLVRCVFVMRNIFTHSLSSGCWEGRERSASESCVSEAPRHRIARRTSSKHVVPLRLRIQFRLRLSFVEERLEQELNEEQAAP